MQRHQTNTERVTKYMEFGHPLNQMFVIDALGKLADAVLADEAATIEAMKDTFVSGEAWIAAAKAWRATEDTQVKCCDNCCEAKHTRRYVVVDDPDEILELCHECYEDSEENLRTITEQERRGFRERCAAGDPTVIAQAEQ